MKYATNMNMKEYENHLTRHVDNHRGAGYCRSIRYLQDVDVALSVYIMRIFGVSSLASTS